MSGFVTLLTSGLYTTIQDKGRLGFSKYGVPKSGAMDQRSFLLANFLLNNDDNCAAIEWMFQPPKLQFSNPTVIVCTGAKCDLFLNGFSCKLNSRIFVNEGDILEIKNVISGCIGYVGIFNGFTSEFVLNSRSFYKGLTKQEVLRKGSKVSYVSYNKGGGNYSSVRALEFWNTIATIDVYKGVEYEKLTDHEKLHLTSTEFTVSTVFNRMAIHLVEVFSNTMSPILTSAVLPGTVQLTPSGSIIILMRDCQSTGGYPRILQLTNDAINCLSQKGIQGIVKFRLVDF